MSSLKLALYDGDLQYRVKRERLRFTKSFYGGIDIEMSFFLPNPLNRDYPYIGYGQKAELWHGHTLLFLSEQREIEEAKSGDTEGINIRCLGYWAFLDDFCYGDKGKLWCDTRYDVWGIVDDDINEYSSDYMGQEHYEMDIRNRLWVAPREGEACDTTRRGGFYYQCVVDDIKRVTFTAAVGDFGDFDAELRAFASDWSAYDTIWQHSVDGAGAMDETLSTERPILEFTMWKTTAGDYAGATGDTYLKITDVKVYGTIDISPTSSDVAEDIIDQIQADTPISSDTSLIEMITLVLTPLVFEQGETCYDALRAIAFYGDSQHKLFGWGVESGADRVFIDAPDYSTVRYVIHPNDAARIARRGTTSEDYMTEGYGNYIDGDGQEQYTDKYYAHVKSDGIVANTTATGDDLASTIYGVRRSGVVDFGPMSPATAIDAIQQYLIEHAHPLVTSSISVQCPVQDLSRGGADVWPFELEVGHIVQIPWFRAVEAEGASGTDIRDWKVGTTFLLAGLEYDDDSGITRLIPEEDTESLERLLSYTKVSEA